MKENLLKIGDTMAVPHHCDVCDKDFLNYIDDKDFEKKSKKKVFINVPDGEVLKLRNTPNNDSTDSIIDEIPNNAEIEILEDNNMIRNGNLCRQPRSAMK